MDKATEELITVAGGIDLTVNFQNGNGSEVVKVRQIPISKLQEYLNGLGDEAKTIELYCDKPKGWADTLTLESATQIADKGQGLNSPFVEAWWKRQAIWREIQMPWVAAVTTTENAETKK
jgi:hypothetical protein